LLAESVAVLVFGDQDVRVVQQSVDGRGRDALGISSSNPDGWMLELIAIERFS
jgi:hypothetical protein